MLSILLIIHCTTLVCNFIFNFVDFVAFIAKRFKGGQAQDSDVLQQVDKSTAKKKQEKKRVHFAEDVKSWDGPRQEHILLEQLVVDFWDDLPSLTVVDKLVDDANEDMLLILHNLLLRVVERVHQTTHSEGAELIVGGGEYGIRMESCDLPSLQILKAHVHKSYEAVAALPV